MSMQVEAVYERGILKLSRELPFHDGQKVNVIIQPASSAVDRLYGMIQWKGSEEDLDYLLGPENYPAATER